MATGNSRETSKAVLITGCSTGIGRAAAEHLAARGWTVYATARRPDSIVDLEGKGCRTLQLDVCDEASARTAIQAVEQEEGAVGVLVNNAGYGQSGAIEAVPMEQVRAQFETNVIGYVRMAQLVLPGMRRQGWGRIVNLSSVAGKVVMPGSGFYAATKHAIEALSDALRFEVKGFGIDVVVIEPGPIRTKFTETANVGMPPESSTYGDFHDAVMKADAETDQSRIAGDAEDVARAIEKAISARRPNARYQVTAVARLLPAIKAALPDRAFDAFLRTQAPAPGHKR